MILTKGDLVTLCSRFKPIEAQLYFDNFSGGFSFLGVIVETKAGYARVRWLKHPTCQGETSKLPTDNLERLSDD
tara:strand:+ start:1170 stop:1391 length:222 start_codon:yes stop_codon:yes gene_type:complete